jgi:hypothetical protein
MIDVLVGADLRVVGRRRVRRVCAWAVIESPSEDGPVKTGNPPTKRAAIRASSDVFAKICFIRPSILIIGMSFKPGSKRPHN